MWNRISSAFIVSIGLKNERKNLGLESFGSSGRIGSV
jgi:hypothetical protein